MLIFIVPAWLITTVIGCVVVNALNKDEVRKSNCRKLLKKYRKTDEAYNKSVF